MRKLLFFLFFLVSLSAFPEAMDSVRSVYLQEVNVVTNIKENGAMRQQPTSVSLIDKDQLSCNHIVSLKGTSTIVPNLFIPDYGSRLTSAIYIRGIGSRINTPAVGLYVDNIPYMDKSAFDFNFYDVERVDLLRGPQGVLYGRNTMGGLMRVHTKNPFYYEGTNVHVGYATGDNHRDVSLTHYHRVSDRLAFSAGGYYEGGDGFFRNDLTGKKVDKISAGGGRWRGIYKPNSRLTFDLSLGYDYTDEGAYPYYYTDKFIPASGYAELLGKISNNRDNSYRRGMFNAGLNLEYKGRGWQMNSVTSYQNINDRMYMDQDFIQPDIYSLEQRQKINTLNEELVFKNTDDGRWQWVSGVNVMYQTLKTESPVVFYADGLRWLESTINSRLPDMSTVPVMKARGFSTMGINFRDEQLAMNGTHDTPTFSTALFHQSTYRFTDRFSASAGVRFEYENERMTYFSPVDVAYGFSMPNKMIKMMSLNIQNLEAHLRQYDGTIKNDRFFVLPKVSVNYSVSEGNNLYASVAMGQRSGGYNLQMFSDLLQGAMRNAMMKGVQEGVANEMQKYINMGMPAAVVGTVTDAMAANMPVGTDPSTSEVEYKPEYSWNYEVGAHLTLLDRTLFVDASLFYSRIYDQQIARFANAGFGRMMVNAGKSKSLGGELEVIWLPTDRLTVMGNYGYTNATFVDYEDGRGNDFSGKHVPFVPRHTMNVDAAYRWPLRDNTLGLQAIAVGANCSGAGRIFWTESNNASQAFYAQLGARLVLESKHCNLVVWGKNLTDRKYDTFYFETAGRGFEQHAKPLQIGVDVNLKF